MTDLVTRLRNPPEHTSGCPQLTATYHDCDCDQQGRLIDLLTEAADHIEAASAHRAAVAKLAAS